MKIVLSGPNGNAFALMKIVKKLSLTVEFADKTVADMMDCGRYEDLLDVMENAFPVATFQFIDDPRDEE